MAFDPCQFLLTEWTGVLKWPNVDFAMIRQVRKDPSSIHVFALELFATFIRTGKELFIIFKFGFLVEADEAQIM